jgi:superfamily II DNA/RNA helicase
LKIRCFHLLWLCFSTRLQVEQSYALVPMERQFAAIHSVLRRHAQETPGACLGVPAGTPQASCLAAFPCHVLPLFIHSFSLLHPSGVGACSTHRPHTSSATRPSTRIARHILPFFPTHSDHKIIAFFTTARLTQYMAALMTAAGQPVLEIHSRKSQVRQLRRAVSVHQGAEGAGEGLRVPSGGCPRAFPVLPRLFARQRSVQVVIASNRSPITAAVAAAAPALQSAREKASKQFREARAGILFSSDVSARGVDYPDVTLVLQARERAVGVCPVLSVC